MYCDLYSQYIQLRKLFKGGNYSRKYGIHYSHFAIYRPSGVRATNITQNLIQRNALYFHLVKRNTLLCYPPSSLSQTQKKSCYSPVHIVVFVHVFFFHSAVCCSYFVASAQCNLPKHTHSMSRAKVKKLKTRKILQ